MEFSILNSPSLVVALDIGSTYSGYAWQSRGEFESNRNNINFNTHWGTGALQLHKTKTCIFIQIKQDNPGSAPTEEPRGSMPPKFRLDPESIEKVKIGHDAEQTYMSIAKKKRIGQLWGNYYLFSRFKLLLYQERFHDNQLVEDQLDQPLPLVDVMVLFIKALKDHCFKKISETRVTVNEQKTLFVVTVPAIWSSKAKMFMRKVAVEAGIGNRNILLALEPEAAAISCMHLPRQMREDMNNFGDKGKRFLVADLGGGTADLSAVEVDTYGNLKELCEPSWRRIGGQYINEAFLKTCHDSFEGDQWRKIFAKATPAEMLRMVADFEQKKMTIGTDDDDDARNIDVAIPEAVKEGLMNKSIQLKSGASVHFEDNEFVFDSAYVRKSLFETTCTELYDNTIKRVLYKPEASGISTVILVGGFVESPIVVRAIREKIAKDFPSVEVVVPYSPFKSVLEGAVLYGHDPMIFSSRKSRETYGVRTNLPFDKTQHDQFKKWKNEETGNFHCKDIFDIHVKKGQSISRLHKQHIEKYKPMYQGQNSLCLPIYASTSNNPKYTTEEGCRQIGEIKVEMPDTTGETSRSVEVAMIYGGTELSIIATDKTTGNEFLSIINTNTHDFKCNPTFDRSKKWNNKEHGKSDENEKKGRPVLFSEK